ncbi:PLD nuclease N-terminal domain-containing protein [Actinomadura hibisca]|uniref:PLD nuclease N-terminal domain-containing protein n=1 Tax=Actinomadura hibisca TaxID=68565 RepID=UPI00082E9A1D|nr:PLD nuclease N-terminal domain-containing protein [Actinomadura hibisca]
MAYVLLALVLVGVWLFCLFDILATDERDVRYLPKVGWLLVTLLFMLAGAVLWLLLGRPRAADRTASFGRADDRVEETGPQAPRPPAPKGPDDDPDFLRDLDRRIHGED